MIKFIILSLLCLYAEKSSAQSYKANLIRQAIDNVKLHTPENSNLLGIKYKGPFTTKETIEMLPDNATLLHENIKGGFDCSDKEYGYYADMDNECKLFHVCFPLNKVFKGLFRDDDILQFAFICPIKTRFTQDAMVCAWEHEAIPCEASEDLYDLNKNFFVIDKKEEEEGKEVETEAAKANQDIERKRNKVRAG